MEKILNHREWFQRLSKADQELVVKHINVFSKLDDPLLVFVHYEEWYKANEFTEQFRESLQKELLDFTCFV